MRHEPTGEAASSPKRGFALKVRMQDRDGFATHAAPEAIEAAILSADRRRLEVEEELRWLRALQAARATQVLRGEWPRAVEP